MSAVKIGTSRQVVIPKKLFEHLKLIPGEYLDVELKGHQLILTPKELVDRRLAIGLADLDTGRVLGPFKTAKAAAKAIKRRPR